MDPRTASEEPKKGETMKLEDKVHEVIGNNEKFIFAFADLKGLVHENYSGFNYGLSIARRLDNGIVDGIKTGPTGTYLQEYKDANSELSIAIKAVSKMLSEENIRNVPIEPTNYHTDADENFRKTLRTRFSHKMAATRAGLGWIGKTDLLVTKQFGPRVRLATVLIEYASLKTGSAIETSRCGTCTLCIEACPAGAANGKAWDVSVDRSDFYDAFKCRDKCRELSMTNLNESVSLCGICVSVCPVGGGRKPPGHL